MRRLLALLFLLLLPACAPAPASTAPAPTASVTRTATPSATLWHLPRPTPYPTWSRVPGVAYTVTPPPLQLTAQVMENLCEVGILLSNDWRHASSPDGTWGAVICDGPGQLTKVFRVDGTKVWSLPRQTLIADPASPLPVQLKPTHWSADGRYLYLRTYFCCVDGPDLFFDDALTSLMRLDLRTGELRPIVPSDHGFAFSFSPDDQYLVFTDPDEHTIIRISDLTSGSRKTLILKTKYIDAGIFSWSPDSSKVAFTAAQSGWVDDTGDFSVLLYDLKTGRLAVLIDNDKRGLSTGPRAWVSAHEIILESWPESDQFKLNILTSQLTPYTPPAPVP